MANPPQSEINFHIISKDSITVSLTKDYFYVPDSCAEISRHTRFDFQKKKFIGKFKDIRVDDSTKVLATGNYDENGFKQGEFIFYYPNGKICSKGHFLNNRIDGKWEIYNYNGKPYLTFRADSSDISIIDIWGINGNKTVVNGSGKAIIDATRYYSWSGTFVGGKRDGIWKMVHAPDNGSGQSVSSADNIILKFNEYFDNGKFIRGDNGATTYNYTSHIVLINPSWFPYVKAESFKFSAFLCNIVNPNYSNAKYKNGDQVLLRFLGTIVDDYIQDYFKDKKNLLYYKCYMTIKGEINEKGRLIHLSPLDNSIYGQNNMIEELARYFPKLDPATQNSKPVKQKIVFTFNFENSGCRYNYKFLPAGY